MLEERVPAQAMLLHRKAAVVTATLAVVNTLAAVAATGNRQLLNQAPELNGSGALHLRVHSRALFCPALEVLADQARAGFIKLPQSQLLRSRRSEPPNGQPYAPRCNYLKWIGGQVNRNHRRRPRQKVLSAPGRRRLIFLCLPGLP